MNIGDLVTYDDEDPETTDFRGEVVEPTTEELTSAIKYALRDEGMGPEVGDVMVSWHDGQDNTFSRAWEHPGYLIPVSERNPL